MSLYDLWIKQDKKQNKITPRNPAPSREGSAKSSRGFTCHTDLEGGEGRRGGERVKKGWATVSEIKSGEKL